LKNSKNLLSILKTKIDDMMFQFDGNLEKTLRKSMTENEIGERIITVQKLEQALSGRVNKDILIEALKIGSTHYEEN
jgi:hypothetical protein